MGKKCVIAATLAVIFLYLSGGAAMAMVLTSPAFENNSVMPRGLTCEGDDASPPLQWYDAPAGVKTFVIICDDPDASIKGWVHWIIYNIPAATTSLPEGVPKSERLSDGSRQGVTDFRSTGYGGPCPPLGKPHRYFFKLYAVDMVLNIQGIVAKDTVLKAMKGHILAEASLVGIYQR